MREKRKERKLVQNQDQRKSRRNTRNTTGETHKKKQNTINTRTKTREIADQNGNTNWTGESQVTRPGFDRKRKIFQAW